MLINTHSSGEGYLFGVAVQANVRPICCTNIDRVCRTCSAKFCLAHAVKLERLEQCLHIERHEFIVSARSAPFFFQSERPALMKNVFLSHGAELSIDRMSVVVLIGFLLISFDFF